MLPMSLSYGPYQIKALQREIQQLKDANIFYDRYQDELDKNASLRRKNKELMRSKKEAVKAQSMVKKERDELKKMVARLQSELELALQQIQALKMEKEEIVTLFSSRIADYKARIQAQEQEILALRDELRQEEDAMRSMGIQLKKVAKIVEDYSHDAADGTGTTLPEDVAAFLHAKKIESAADRRTKERLEKTHTEQEKVILESEKEIVSLQETIRKMEASLLHERSKNNKDSSNSSRPSSTNGFTIIQNNRVKSGKNIGGQPGHEGHCLGLASPVTQTIDLPVPASVLSDPDKEPTGSFKCRNVVDLQVVISVTRYRAPVYRDRDTGKMFVPVSFPKGMDSPVVYGPALKSILVLLRVFCNVPYHKLRSLMAELTDGAVVPSTGSLVNFEKSFSKSMTREEVKALEDRILSQPYVYTDCTSVHAEGHLEHILVVGNEKGVMYYHGKKKGLELTEKSLLKDYKGIVISDAEASFFRYGIWHQLCVIHELRYLKGVIMEHPETSEWAGELRGLLLEAIKEADKARASGSGELDIGYVSEINARYKKILEKALAMYDTLDEELYKVLAGPKVARRLLKNQGYLLTFLNFLWLDFNNNFSERQLRIVKVHTKQSGGYRKSESIDMYLNALIAFKEGILKGKSRLSVAQEYFKKSITFETVADPIL